MRKLFLSLLVLMATLNLFAQNGDNAIGIRISDNFGITFKHELSSNTVLEGIVGLPRNSLILTGLYEKYYKIEGARGLNWFFGGGVYVGINSSSAGLAGALGLCYTFPDIPVEISLDWMPHLQVVGNTGLYVNTFGLSGRYKF